jgi:hypothetical protein
LSNYGLLKRFPNWVENNVIFKIDNSIFEFIDNL